MTFTENNQLNFHKKFDSFIDGNQLILSGCQAKVSKGYGKRTRSGKTGFRQQEKMR